MAQVTETGQGGKRTLVTDVNLVPFIDLLSVCICFLLMTAVWVQLGVLEVKQSQGTSAAVAKGGFEIGVTLLDPLSVQMELRKNARVIKRQKLIGKSLQELQDAIGQTVQKFRKTTKNSVTAALLTPNHAVNYKHLVAVMDTLRRQEIVNLGVLAIGGVK